MSWFTFVAFPAFRVTATLEAAPGFLIAGAAAAETGLARATRYQRISKESYVTAFADKIEFISFRSIQVILFKNYFYFSRKYLGGGIFILLSDRIIKILDCAIYENIISIFMLLPLAMIAGVTVWTLRAHVSAIYVGGVIELTVWTEIVALDQKWAAASFAIVRCALQSNTVKTGRAAIAFRAHGVVFAGLSGKNKIDFKLERFVD